MRLLVSALLLAAASPGFAQNQAAPSPNPAGMLTLGLEAVPVHGPDNQAGCPVVFTHAHLVSQNTAGIFPVSAAGLSAPSLDLRFQNASGKRIHSVGITVRMTGKTDKYQLDADTFLFHFTFSGTDAVDRAAEQLRQIQVPKNMYPYGLNMVALQQVVFADGSTWTAGPETNCRYRATSERIGMN